MLKNETILITGGTGYLGSRLLEKCLSLGAQVILLKRSYSSTNKITHLLPKITAFNLDQIQLHEIFNKHSISIILHCATHYARHGYSKEDVIKTNIHFPQELLLAAVKYNVKTFINTDTFLDKKISFYAESKKTFLEILKNFEKNLCCINMCLEYFYGPRDSSHKLLTYLTHEMYLKKESLDLTLGEQKRDFIYIEDVLTAYETILTSALLHQKGGFHFEVGTGQSISIKNLALLIKELLKNTTTKLNFGAIPYRENELYDSKVNIKPLKDLGWNPHYSLKEGLKKMIEFEGEGR